MTQRQDPIDVFGYLEVRSYLRDVYDHKKEHGRGFSFRAFSRRAGLRSPNHLKRVIDGERVVTAEMAPRYAKALGLDGDAASYFCDLAAFSRARSDPERNAAYTRLANYKEYRLAQTLELAQAAYHANWYIPAIRELANRADFRAEPAWIAKRMLPRITTSEAKGALDVLFELGLLLRTDEGRVVQGEPVLTTGAETRGLHIRNYHRAMMERAAESMALVPAPQRDISSLTFCVDDEGLRRVKERVQQFRKELIAILSDETDGDRVVQLNFQLFPLSSGQEDP